MSSVLTPRSWSTAYSSSPKSSPTGPTTRTSQKKLAASEKWTAEPPSMRSRSPKGVFTASKAIEPTTTSVMRRGSLLGTRGRMRPRAGGACAAGLPAETATPFPLKRAPTRLAPVDRGQDKNPWAHAPTGRQRMRRRVACGNGNAVSAEAGADPACAGRPRSRQEPVGACAHGPAAHAPPGCRRMRRQLTRGYAAPRMRAIQIEEFGGPELMQLVDLPVPEPGDGEVLVRVTRAGVNFAD